MTVFDKVIRSAGNSLVEYVGHESGKLTHASIDEVKKLGLFQRISLFKKLANQEGDILTLNGKKYLKVNDKLALGLRDGITADRFGWWTRITENVRTWFKNFFGGDWIKANVDKMKEANKSLLERLGIQTSSSTTQAAAGDVVRLTKDEVAQSYTTHAGARVTTKPLGKVIVKTGQGAEDLLKNELYLTQTQSDLTAGKISGKLGVPGQKVKGATADAVGKEGEHLLVGEFGAQTQKYPYAQMLNEKGKLEKFVEQSVLEFDPNNIEHLRLGALNGQAVTTRDLNRAQLMEEIEKMYKSPDVRQYVRLVDKDGRTNVNAADWYTHLSSRGRRFAILAEDEAALSPYAKNILELLEQASPTKLAQALSAADSKKAVHTLLLETAKDVATTKTAARNAALEAANKDIPKNAISAVYRDEDKFRNILDGLFDKLAIAGKDPVPVA